MTSYHANLWSAGPTKICFLHPCLKPWVIIKSSGSVVYGHCTCKAGQGEICYDVKGVLSWLETNAHIMDQTSFTSKENTWIEITAVKNTIYLRLKHTYFTSTKKKVKCAHKCEGAIINFSNCVPATITNYQSI